jgi:integrase
MNQRDVNSARPDPNGAPQRFIWDDEIRGFGLRINATGAKTFVFQARTRGARPRRIVIGPYPALSLTAARAIAAGMRATLAGGGDPIAERRAALAAAPAVKEMTLGEFIPIYIDRHAKAHKRSWLKDEQDLKRYLPDDWYGRPLSAFTTGDMAALHATIGKRGEYVANGLMRLLRSMLNLAVDWGYLPETHINPIRRRFQWFREQSRERYLTPAEWERLDKALDRDEFAFWRGFFQLCLFTGQRRGEVAGAKWNEIDLETAKWTIPAERTKANRATTVPLITQAVTLLSELPSRGKSPFLFPSPHRPGRPVSEVKSAWAALKLAAGLSDTDLRPHDLRRTPASYLAADGNGLPIIGKLLNHSRSETTAIYARINVDPVRAALQTTMDAVYAARTKRKVVRMSDRNRRASRAKVAAAGSP